MFYKICCLKNILKDFLNVIFLCATMAMSLHFVVASRLLDYQTANVADLSEWQDAYCLRLFRRFVRSWFFTIVERMFTIGDIERLLTTDRCNAQRVRPTRCKCRWSEKCACRLLFIEREKNPISIRYWPLDMSYINIGPVANTLELNLSKCFAMRFTARPNHILSSHELGSSGLLLVDEIR